MIIRSTEHRKCSRVGCIFCTFASATRQRCRARSAPYPADLVKAEIAMQRAVRKAREKDKRAGTTVVATTRSGWRNSSSCTRR